MTKYLWALCGLMVCLSAGCTGSQPVGIANLMAIERLPYFKPGETVHYAGSIDKMGGNADYDWCLYQDAVSGEYVLFDVDGPGCIYNFVQHRYPSSTEPTFRFYFDGERTARFAIRPSEFGTRPPFVEPLAAAFEGDDPVPTGRGPIRVVRSFVPMAFRKSCKVTSSIKLEGFERSRGHGGWGHFVYHSYPTPDGVETFTGREDYTRLLQRWRAVGQDPKPAVPAQTVSEIASLEPMATQKILDYQGRGSIGAIRLNMDNSADAIPRDLWIRIRWDGPSQPAVECPVGAFFGNELGHHAVKYLTMGTTEPGQGYNYFPMPFWHSAQIELINRSPKHAMKVNTSVRIDATDYPENRCGYFNAVYRPAMATTLGRDSSIASIQGYGHVVAGVVSQHAQVPGSCEGDVRVYIDGLRTPRIQSDGSESWVCYGWGFCCPPQSNPTGGYDSVPPDSPWSQTRLLMGDWYPFAQELRFGIEAGGSNDQALIHSGAIFYYGRSQATALRLTDTLDVGDAQSEKQHDYQLSGSEQANTLTSTYEDDGTPGSLSDHGYVLTGASSFVVSIDPANQGIRLRRRSDQRDGRQRAAVYVDGRRVVARDWYFADYNPTRRWLEDEFEIPAAYTAHKRQLQIRIEPLKTDGEACWNEYHYWVYSHLRPSL